MNFFLLLSCWLAFSFCYVELRPFGSKHEHTMEPKILYSKNLNAPIGSIGLRTVSSKSWNIRQVPRKAPRRRKPVTIFREPTDPRTGRFDRWFRFLLQNMHRKT